MTKSLNLSNYTSIKIGPIVEVEIISDIVHVDKNTLLLGGGNNLLVSAQPPKIAMLSKDFSFLHVEDGTLHVGAATPSGKILSFVKKHDIANFELMQKLPGTLGGMLKMNAGLKEWEIFNHLIAVKTQDGWIEKKDIEYGYRHAKIGGTIYEATFEIHKGFDNQLLEMFKKFRDNQPQLPSAGSCFKNPQGYFAGKLLDEAGLKGYQIGNMAFSDSHANFLVNLGGGTFSDALDLIHLAKKRVLTHSGVNLHEEIIIV